MASKTMPILISVAGGVFIYSGFKGMSLSIAARDLLTGRNPGLDSQQTSSSLSPSPQITKGFHFFPSTNLSQQENRNRGIGKLLAAAMGWTGEQWQALDQLWGVHESGWNNYALNKHSGAYGIAQALPSTKYPKAGQSFGGSDPRTQILWGLKYIKERYGSPIAALQHELTYGWY